MKTLICLSGLVRNEQPFIKSFCARVLDRLPHKPDLVGHFPTPRTDSLASLADGAAHATLRFDDDPDFGDIRRFEQHAGAARHGTHGNMLQWNSMARCADMKAEREAETGLYDLVIWSRPDLYFMTDFDEFDAVAPNTLYVPAHDSWGGIMDRFCYGSSEVLDRRLRILDHFTGRFLEERILPEDAPSWNAEHVFRHYVEAELSYRVVFSRVVTGRIRELDGTYEIVRPRCRQRKNTYDARLSDPAYRRAMHRLDRMSWNANPTPRGRTERRLPLDVVTAEIARPPGPLGG
jgi:hypothetical protein